MEIFSDEILLTIFRNVPFCSLDRVARTCRRFARVAREPSLCRLDWAAVQDHHEESYWGDESRTVLGAHCQHLDINITVCYGACNGHILRMVDSDHRRIKYVDLAIFDVSGGLSVKYSNSLEGYILLSFSEELRISPWQLRPEKFGTSRRLALVPGTQGFVSQCVMALTIHDTADQSIGWLKDHFTVGWLFRVQLWLAVERSRTRR